jgi:hypothetical protein
MKGRKAAWALILLGIGLVVGIVLGSSIFLVRDQVVERVGGRAAFLENLDGRLGRSVEITIPEVPEQRTVRIRPGTRLLRPFASEDVFIRDRLPFSIWGAVRTAINWVVNGSALLLILLGVFLIVRRSRQSVEKTPSEVLTYTD